MFWQKKIDSTLIKFLMVGILNTMTGFFLIYFFKWGFKFGDAMSNFLGYFLGFILSFFLNSKWTFRYRGDQVSAIVKLFLVTIFGYLVNLSLVLAAIQVLQWNGDVAHPVGLVPYTLICYFGSKYWVFPNSKIHQQENNEQLSG